jgi:hypothetical protein
MTETMLEKAARAMFDADSAENGLCRDWSLEAGCRPTYRAMARAAIEAIREPNLKMRQAATTFTGADIDWPAMIDTILSQSQE